MIRSLIVALLIASFAMPGASIAQSFTPVADTVFINIGGKNDAYGVTKITVPGMGGVNIDWKVVASNFPADWLKSGDFGICDAMLCYNNMGDTLLWDKTKAKGAKFSCNYASGTGGILSLALNNMTGKTMGCYYVSVQFTDIAPGGTVDTITFAVCRSTLGLATTQSTANDDIVLYPNPAGDELNVLFGVYNDIKSMVVYNVIGKAMNVYKVAGNSASIDLAGMPSGIYFVKLYGSMGNVVATRKFTKQ